MKKLIALIVVVMMVFSFAAHAEIDLSMMTDEELNELINNAIVEQWRRKYDSARYYTDSWVYDGEDGLRFRLSSDVDTLGSNMIMTLEVDNGTDEGIYLFPTKMTVNGWDVEGNCYDEISAHGKRRCSLYFDMNQADIRGLSDIQLLAISFSVTRSYDYSELYTLGPFYFQGN